jgi:hypothetical protein
MQDFLLPMHNQHFLQRANQIVCVDNLIRTQNQINVYLDPYAYWQAMDTLNELESDLARIFHLKDSNELLIGSVEKQAKILELFRLNHYINKDLKSFDVFRYLD